MPSAEEARKPPHGISCRFGIATGPMTGDGPLAAGLTRRKPATARQAPGGVLLHMASAAGRARDRCWPARAAS